MVVFVALLMTAAVFALVGYPLARPGRGEKEFMSTDRREADNILARRDDVNIAIEELEFEFHLGNLSQRDYEELRARYHQQAEDILRELEAIQ
jgi:hypothetical protein